ncbi:MAG: hypothetical protein HQL69_17360 [Magnetococcales bacterium]|nr:hypothetical protein [Magnetococcales bacterium]
MIVNQIGGSYRSFVCYYEALTNGKAFVIVGRKYLMAMSLILTALVTTVAYPHGSDLPVVGYVEKVKILLPYESIVLKAKIDIPIGTSY